MKENKSTKFSVNSLFGKSVRFNSAFLFIMFMAVFCAAASVVRATPIDVKAPPYNAAGNDIADDRGPIQNAINDAAVTGQTVYFPPGLYKISGTIYVPSNVRLQGMGSTVYNAQLRLSPQQTALFEVQDGASNIVFKDLALVANSNPNVYPRNTAPETALIRTEGTVGIAFKAGNRGISNIVIENVRINQFTQGIAATSVNLGQNSSITNVKIRNYASDGNEYSLYTNTTGASDWDVQNMNVYPMYHEQNGILLERSGEMRFLQLSCAGLGAGVCAKLWGNGDTYFRQMHVEGPRIGFCIGTNCNPNDPNEIPVENSSVITVENSATGGDVHRATNLVLINNRFWLDFPDPAVRPYWFYGTGANSSLAACANVWVSWYPTTHMSNTTVTPPTNPYPGLVTPVQGCLDSSLTTAPVFDTGYEPDNERLANGTIDVTAFPYSAIPNDGIDDTAAFQSALADAAFIGNRGRRVFVPAGTFDIYSTLDLNPAIFAPNQDNYPQDGLTVLGEEGSVIHLKGESLSLFRVVNKYGYPVNGITFRNLTLTSDSTKETIGINFENFDPSVVGAASDFQIQNVDVHGFGTGIAVRPVNGLITNAQPMFDSASIKDGDFTGNKIAVLINSSNASHWNLENLRVEIPDGEKGVRIDNGGHVGVRNLFCTGDGLGESCVTIQRQSGTFVEGITAAGVLNALVVPWENGWTQFPVTLRNNDLQAGVYFQGRIYLNSVNNIYPAKLRRHSTARDVRFGAYQEGNPNNVAYGALSDIFSCDDIFRDPFPIIDQSTWVYVGTLNTPVTYCN